MGTALDVATLARLIAKHRLGAATRFRGEREEHCVGCAWHGPLHEVHLAEVIVAWEAALAAGEPLPQLNDVVGFGFQLQDEMAPARLEAA